MSRLKVIGSTRPGDVILRCECGRSEFAAAGEAKYVCAACGVVVVIRGAKTAMKDESAAVAPEPKAPEPKPEHRPAFHPSPKDRQR